MVSVILTIVTVILLIINSNRKNKYIECTGVIAGFYENDSELRVDAYETKAVSPVITYTVNGKSYEFVGNYYATTMKVGQRVKVLHSREDFSKATVKKGIYLAPVITGGLAVLFALPVVIISVLKAIGIIFF